MGEHGHEAARIVKLALDAELELDLELWVVDRAVEHVSTVAISHSRIQLDFFIVQMGDPRIVTSHYSCISST